MACFRGPAGQVLESKSKKVCEIFREWSLLDKNIVAAKVNGRSVDLTECVSEDAEVEPIYADTEEGLEILRHSTSHLMAQAVLRLFPGAKLGIGPAIKDGFYYDIQFPTPLSEEDLPKIEEMMRRIADEALPIERREVSKKDAIHLFQERGEPFKVELLEAIQEESVSLYFQGEFVDLCRGPHVPDTSYIKHFKLLSIAGAYWHGDEKNVMLTRIYGTAFADEEALARYLEKVEQARLRDHRKLGRELDLFSLQPEGPGFPFIHPKGMAVINALLDFWRKEHFKRGYSEIRTPLILDRDLWIRSGHWDHYRENMYFTEIDERPFAIKPMNCPGGILIYKSAVRSYRDLPMRMAELGVVHRHERSGVLHGLMRVRCFTQDDAHLFCTPDQITDEIVGIMDLVNYTYNDVFGFKYHVELSTRPENSMGTQEEWDRAESALKEALERVGIPYRVNPGDGAFYGPKIDFHLEDCIGRTWQCGTIQLDFQMPEKFDMTYIGPDGLEHRPVMLHRTVFGSLERFFGILIEHYAGAFPFWLAPVQVKILPVKTDFLPYTREIEAKLRSEGFRTEVDLREEKLGKKIRDAQMQKVPIMLVLGAKEVEEGQVSVRDRVQGDLGTMTLEQLIDRFRREFSPQR